MFFESPIIRLISLLFDGHQSTLILMIFSHNFSFMVYFDPFYFSVYTSIH